MKHRTLLPILGLALCACNTDRDRYVHDERDRPAESSASYSKQSKSSSTPAASAAAEASYLQGSQALPAGDRDFVTAAGQGGMFEVESSKLALRKDVSGAIREFAQMMVDDHGRANRELGELARKKGATLPVAMKGEHQRACDELQGLQGREFERRYRELQVEAHDEAILLFGRCARECTDPDLRGFASDALPTLREHRRRLDQLSP